VKPYGKRKVVNKPCKGEIIDNENYILINYFALTGLLIIFP